LRRATCRSVSSSWFAARSHDEAAVRRGDPSWHILTPIISDQVSIPDGVVGDVAEIGCEVGDVVEEGHVAVIIETHKACLNVKATGARTMRVVEILASVGDEVKESDPLVLVERAPE
jgi:biotin carboxyl carrier protein